MGCHTSRTTADEVLRPADCTPTKGTAAATQPSAAKVQQRSADGSDTSTDDASSGSTMEPRSSVETEEEAPRDLGSDAMADTGRDEPFLEVASGQEDSLPSEEEQPRVLRRGPSCLSGTTPREAGRRVSFTERSPDVLEIERIERPDVAEMGTLRRANAVNAMEMPDDIDPSMEAMMQLQASGAFTSEVAPPWVGIEAQDPVFQPANKPLALRSDTQPACFGKFSLCCVARDEFAMPVQGELEYDLWHDGSNDDAFLPYASQVHGMQIQQHAMVVHSKAATQNGPHGVWPGHLQGRPGSGCV